MTEQITSSGFHDFTSQDGLVLALFWSTSCGPCLRFRRIYKAVDAKFPDIAFGEAEVEIQFRLVEELEISTIPVLLVYRDGELIYRDPTPRPESATYSTINGAPRFRDFMYSEDGLTAFVESLR
ncbi:MAG: thioredoxin family protein [Corynebacterium sp.]|uniref:thioredoxin family protein n=1 Tax=Corynebacterium sp. TaxID=1720 RepID=UPI0026E03CF0|nr:thioredoxin family protein [Corynebacterium sp.]MDO5670596.1 thioredoxin family protein [Corynebacterium sp.]